MNEVLDYLKELLLIKEEKALIGLTSLKNQSDSTSKKIVKKKVKKEVNLSDLMRRTKPVQ